MADYSNDWPIHDMLKVHLKNSSQIARSKRGRETAEAIGQGSLLPWAIVLRNH